MAIWCSWVGSPKSLPPGNYAVLTVSDNGTGIDPDIIDKIFEPYYTTKEKGKGTGLGLAVVYGMVKEHLGEIKVASELSNGSTFKLYFPVIDKSPEMQVDENAEALLTGNEKILLIDDEEPIARLQKQGLERLGYQVTMQTNSPEARQLFLADPAGFDLVITDMTMPYLTGDQLAREMISIRPDIPVIICTGFSERINEEKAELLGIKAFLMKPVVRSELAKAVRQVLDAAD